MATNSRRYPPDPSTIYDAFYEGAQKWYLGEAKGKRHPPMLCLITTDGALNFVVADDGEPPTQESFFERHAKAVGSIVPSGNGGMASVAISLMMVEAQAVNVEHAAEVMKKSGGELDVEALRNQPSHMEVLVFDIHAAQGHAVMLCRIHRDTGILEKDPFDWADEPTFTEKDKRTLH